LKYVKENAWDLVGIQATMPFPAACVTVAVPLILAIPLLPKGITSNGI
jgi:hypothetical protein